MPILVRPEDIKLPKRKLKKDILCRLGLEEGKRIGLEEGFIKALQNTVLTLTKSKMGQIPEGIRN